MLIVRPVTAEDIDGILELAKKAYPGMTTLPPDRIALTKKIEVSLASMAETFEEKNQKHALNECGSDSISESAIGDQTYMLVMEDSETNTVVGTASIIARLGENDQFYSYKLNKMTYSHKALDKKVSVESLHLSNHFEGFAEVASLYLAEPFRKNGNGKLLAKSRYLFMAKFRERFPEQVMADLRGYFDSDGNSPFWNALGQHFFDMSFAEADLYGSLNGNQFIADLMPKQPVYVNLLPQDAQDAIGRPNDQGKAALAMLEKEGFRWNGHIDIFDGSPSVDVYIDQLESVKARKDATFSTQAAKQNLHERFLLSAGDISNFRVCVSEGICLEKEGNTPSLLLPQETQEALQLSANELVSFISL